MKKNNIGSKLIRNSSILSISILIAILLAKTGVFEHLLVRSQNLEILGNFVAGIFFTSILTAAPGTVVLGELSLTTNLIQVATIGALGSLVGDYIIFHFVRDSLAENINVFVNTIGRKNFFDRFRSRRLSWFSSILGAIIVASPLPDEIGLTLMGLAKIKTIWFIPLSFSLNFLGILLIGFVARSI